MNWGLLVNGDIPGVLNMHNYNLMISEGEEKWNLFQVTECTINRLMVWLGPELPKSSLCSLSHSILVYFLFSQHLNSLPVSGKFSHMSNGRRQTLLLALELKKSRYLFSQLPYNIQVWPSTRFIWDLESGTSCLCNKASILAVEAATSTHCGSNSSVPSVDIQQC